MHNHSKLVKYLVKQRTATKKKLFFVQHSRKLKGFAVEKISILTPTLFNKLDYFFL